MAWSIGAPWMLTSRSPAFMPARSAGPRRSTLNALTVFLPSGPLRSTQVAPSSARRNRFSGWKFCWKLTKADTTAATVKTTSRAFANWTLSSLTAHLNSRRLHFDRYGTSKFGASVLTPRLSPEYTRNQ